MNEDTNVVVESELYQYRTHSFVEAAIWCIENVGTIAIHNKDFVVGEDPEKDPGTAYIIQAMTLNVPQERIVCRHLSTAQEILRSVFGQDILTDWVVS